MGHLYIIVFLFCIFAFHHYCCWDCCKLESQLLGGQSLLNPRYLCLKLSEMIDFLDNLYFFLLGAAHRWLSLTRIAAVAGLDRHQSLCARNSGGCNCCIWILLWLYLYFVFGAVSHRGCLSLRLLTGLDRRQSLCACNSGVVLTPEQELLVPTGLSNYTQLPSKWHLVNSTLKSD